MKLIGTALGLVFIPTVALSCEATKAAYDKLESKMPQKQGESIIGCEGTSISENEVGGFRTVVFVWRGADPNGKLVVTFQNDKLIGKSQSLE